MIRSKILDTCTPRLRIFIQIVMSVPPTPHHPVLSANFRYRYSIAVILMVFCQRAVHKNHFNMLRFLLPQAAHV